MENNILSILTAHSMIMAFVYLAGIIIQCLSLLRKRPSKASVFIFLGMLGYLTVLIIYSIAQSPREQIEKSLMQAVVPHVISSGFIIALLFIAIFLKKVVKIIDETIIFSLTLSFWFLMINYSGSFSTGTVTAFIIIGILSTAIMLYLFIHAEKVKEIHKYFLYGWYLFINVVFSFSYYFNLPCEFFLSGGLIFNGMITWLEIITLGMVVVHIVFIAGILYYTMIYSLFSPDARFQVITYSSRLFRDRRIKSGELINISIIHLGSFILFSVLSAALGFYLFSLWILLTPLVMQLWRYAYSFFSSNDNN